VEEAPVQWEEPRFRLAPLPEPMMRRKAASAASASQDLPPAPAWPRLRAGLRERGSLGPARWPPGRVSAFPFAGEVPCLRPPQQSPRAPGGGDP
jgi:hypothetical protein